MKRRLALPSILAFILTGCGVFTHKPAQNASPGADDAQLPTAFDFSLKRNTDDEEDALTLHYYQGKLYVSDKRDGNTDAYQLTPSKEAWQSFWKSADSISLWQWKSAVEPGDPDFLWSLDLKRQDRENVIHGNHFKLGRDGSPGKAKDGWITFATALQRLLQHEIPVLRESME